MVLSPGSVTGPIDNIMWRDGQNIAAQWRTDDSDVSYNRHFKGTLTLGGTTVALWDFDCTNTVCFKERGSLDTSSGALTIRALTRNDSKLYTVQINSTMATPTLLTVLGESQSRDVHQTRGQFFISHLFFCSAPVPVPTVTASCNEEKSSCTLTCEGNIKDVELVVYNWKSDDLQLTDSSKDHLVEKVRQRFSTFGELGPGIFLSKR